MPGSAVWFVLVAVMLPAAWWAGRASTRIQDKLRRGCVIGLAFVLLIGWSWLIRRPALAVHVLPLPVLARLEGIGAAPLFLFMLGVGWHMAALKRQRAIVVVGLALGMTYFLQGGLWMMHPTPSNAFAQSSRNSDGLFVRQTQDYSCVPAAAATALRIIGVDSSEAQMAELTETRAGTGATLLRALNGIDARLKNTPIRAKLLQPDYETLLKLEPPMLTPVQYEATQLHMVTIIEVRPDLVVVADPQVGIEFILREQFEAIYRDQVIAFEGNVPRANTEDLLRQNRAALTVDAARLLTY